MPSWPTINGKRPTSEELFAAGDQALLSVGRVCYKILAHREKTGGDVAEYKAIVKWVKSQPSVPDWKENRLVQESILKDWECTIRDGVTVISDNQYYQSEADKAIQDLSR